MKPEPAEAEPSMRSAFSDLELPMDKHIPGLHGATQPAPDATLHNVGGNSPAKTHNPSEDSGAKRWAFGSFLSRSRSDASKTDVNPEHAHNNQSNQKTMWFSGKRSKHSRTNSAGPVLASPLQTYYKPPSDVPIVGGLPLIAGPLPEGSGGDQTLSSHTGQASVSTTDDGMPVGTYGVAQRTSNSISAPPSAMATPEDVPSLDIASSQQPRAGHRRHRSLLESLGWSRSKTGIQQSSTGTSANGDADTGSQDGGQREDDVSSLDIELGPDLPLGTRGIANVGNSCFLSAALQCVRYTPNLPLVLIPDLLEKAEKLKSLSPREGTKNASEGACDHNDSTPTTTVAPLNDAATGEEGTEPTTSNTSTEVNNQHDDVDEVERNQEEPDIMSGNDQDDPTCPKTTTTTTEQPMVPSEKPQKGELAAALACLLDDLYLGTSKDPVSPLPLLHILRRFPTAEEYFDGRQQDCQEVLQILLDLLHEDLASDVKNNDGDGGGASNDNDDAYDGMDVDGPSVAIDDDGTDIMNGTVVGRKSQRHRVSVEKGRGGLPPRPPSAMMTMNGDVHHPQSTVESRKADDLWRKVNTSPISNMFMGQIQSSVNCSKCGGRFTMYEPFWELSLPLAPKSGGTFSWLSFNKGGSSSLSLQDCLRAFTADEKLEGKEAFHCEKCNEKTSATKKLKFHRLPDALVLHVKRFKHVGYGATGADKVTTDVAFPVKELDLSAHLSTESPVPPESCIYDLYAVSYHTGSLAGGHYTASCLVRPRDDTWWYFNDENVSAIDKVKVPNAYIMFYARRKFKDPIAAAHVFENLHFKRSTSGGGGGGNSSGGAHHHQHSRSRSGGKMDISNTTAMEISR